MPVMRGGTGGWRRWGRWCGRGDRHGIEQPGGRQVMREGIQDGDAVCMRPDVANQPTIELAVLAPRDRVKSEQSVRVIELPVQHSLRFLGHGSVSLIDLGMIEWRCGIIEWHPTAVVV